MKQETLNRYLEGLSNIGLKTVLDFEKLKELQTTEKFDLIDNKGYKYNLSLQNLSTINRRKTVPNIFFGGNIHTKHNINNYLKINNIDLELITDNPKNATCKLEFKCLKHNSIFNRSWNSVKNGSVMCDECLKIFKGNKASERRNSIEEIRKFLESRDCELITKVYINNIQKLEFVCNKHKDKGIQYKTWGDIRRKITCLYCSKESTSLKMRKTHEEFEKQFKEIHGDDCTLINEYVDTKTKIKVHCNKCGKNFESAPHHLLEGHGCKYCNKSLGENIIEDYLKLHNIEFVDEYTFENCIGITKKRKLPFDFAIFEENKLKCLIEYDGIQHFKPVEIFGGQAVYDTQVKNDNIKTKYCKENNIKLIRIPYWEKKNINLILDKELNER